MRCGYIYICIYILSLYVYMCVCLYMYMFVCVCICVFHLKKLIFMFIDVRSTNVASGTEERAVSWNQKKLGLYLLSVPICVDTTRLTDMIPLYPIFRSPNFTKLHENVSKQHITLDKKYSVLQVTKAIEWL